MVQLFTLNNNDSSAPTRRRRRCTSSSLVSAFLPASTLHFSLSSSTATSRNFRAPLTSTEHYRRRRRCTSVSMSAASDDIRQYPLQPPSSSQSSSPVESNSAAQSAPLESNSTSSASSPIESATTAAPTAAARRAARFKVQRRIGIGFIMGAVVIAFVFSGTYPFLMGMLAVCLIGQGEYFKMVYAKGHLPAWKMALCVTTILMVCCARFPGLADVAFPLGATFICIYLLFRRKKIATIADISTTFMGLFYAGYLPSFWVRLHEYTGGYVPAKLLSLSATGPFVFTGGSLLVFWTWLSAVSSDVGAFFIGRTYGRTRFTNISPKKTVEGAVAGFICSASVSILGAYLLKWPLWYATGAVYGVMVGVVGLMGDLFESCFKRDVGWKDSGSLFPGHGGMLDRADSYVLTAPLVYFFTTLVLPAIKKMCVG